MGKSDSYLLNFYLSFLENKEYENVGFFGQPSDNFISRNILSKERSFYDISLGNWNINDPTFNIDNEFDLIVCTRCAYFCKNPKSLLSNFKKMLKPEGKILIDWGLGDHWRFDNFKVGWVRDGEHEWAYSEENFLWSAYLSENMKNKNYSNAFLAYCSGYPNNASLEEIIYEEVPSVITQQDILKLNLVSIKEQSLFLWPDSPQLYTCLLLGKK